MDTYNNLKAMVESVAADMQKALEGNKAAGTRVRKTMQDVKKAAQALRVELMAVRSKE